MDPAVHLRSAVALAGRFPALSGVDLDVAPGEVVVLIGPNGAGKTSLLRTCAGLVPVSSGEALVLGCDLRHDRSQVRSRIGLLGHDPALYDELTASENVRFFARAAGIQASAAGAALERCGIVGRLARTPAAKLSAGQRRRLALAVLVARSPELWLLDEPHAALDASGRSLVDELVADSATRGATVMLTSHEPDAAAAIADRVVAMAGGRVSSTIPPLAVVGGGDADVA